MNRRRRRRVLRAALQRTPPLAVPFALADRYAERAGLPQPQPGRRRVTLTYPTNFSFIDNPEETIEALQATIQAVRARPRSIEFDQREVTNIDLCAASVLNAIVRDARRKYAVRVSGKMPTDAEAYEIIAATGIPYELGLKFSKYHGKKYLHFRLREGNARRASLKSKADKHVVATSITTYFDKCLDAYGFQLTSSGKEAISALTSEVIDNAERHSQEYRWWVAGYMRKGVDEQPGDCHIVIFNIGSTIAESLQSLPADAEIRAEITELIDKHAGKGLLGKLLGWNEDSLWTLYALQQGISARNREKRGQPVLDNGQGTVQLISFFQDLGRRDDGRAEPRMTIVSGSTQILFDGRYSLLHKRNASGQLQKIITFNKEESLEYPPDRRSVRAMNADFAGTVISMRFFLDKAHLMKAFDAA